MFIRENKQVEAGLCQSQAELYWEACEAMLSLHQVLVGKIGRWGSCSPTNRNKLKYGVGGNKFTGGKTCWQSKESYQLDQKCCQVYEDRSNSQDKIRY